MSLGRIFVDILEQAGPFFSGLGEIFAELLPEIVKVIGFIVGADNVLITIAALFATVVVWMIRRGIKKRRFKSAASEPGPILPAFFLGLFFGLAALGSIYFLWRSNVGGYIDEARMLAVAPAIGVPVLTSLFFLRLNSWQPVPLAIILFGVALTAVVCVADMKIFL